MKLPLVRILLLPLFSSLSLCGEQPPNVLMIAVDDLKPLIGAYGDPIAVTPTLDRLAARGTLFTNAHCQQAVCGPSRASAMTGLRPDQTRIWDLKTKIRNETPDIITLPQYFKRNGYHAAGVGKIFDYRSVEGHERDDPASWSGPYTVFPKNPDEEFGLLDRAFVSRVRAERAKLPPDAPWNALKEAIGGSPPFESTQAVDDEAYDDGRIAATAIGLLEELAPQDTPFFLAVGFKKPHLPFVAPKKYWDLYAPDQFAPHPLTKRPEGSPVYHHQPGWELRNGSYSGVPLLSEDVPIPDPTAVKLIHGYYACVSYVDAQVARVIEALEATGEADNTIIALWSDHGFHLGDHGMWCKHTNYEQSTRIPFLLIDPRGTKIKRGTPASQPVELIDLYPTLCDLAGLEIPAHTQGTSLTPILLNPQKAVKPYAVSQFPRTVEGREIMGYSWRTDRYRYIEWEDNRFREGGSTGEVLDIELYDYRVDPEETRNLADDPTYADVLRDLQRGARVFKLTQRARADDAQEIKPSWLEVADTTGVADPTASLSWREADVVIPYAQTPQGELVLHVFKPTDWSATDQRAVFVAFHGGGWNSGEPRAFFWQAAYLRSRGMVVICPEYRIRSRHGTSPLESTRDAMHAMQFIRAHANDLGIDPERIVAAGGSAGGHLAAATATVPGFASSDAGLKGISPRPNALVLFNPVLDTTRKGFGSRQIKPSAAVLSPIDQLNGIQPPTIIFNGDRDTTTSAERAFAFAEKMNALGNRCELVLYPGQTHSFFNKGHSEASFSDTLNRTAGFLESLAFLESQPCCPTPSVPE